MNRYMTCCCLALALISTSSAARDDWQCRSHDGLNKEWTGRSDYERAALNKAFDACRKASDDPASCKVAKVDCEFFVNGQTTQAMWQCVAMDQMAKVWPSNPYPQRDDAAIAAREYCQSKSGYPDTCYTNLMTCKNLNERE
ncbi:hypothetical protein [Legionella sp. CNM-4043-24]|uniref:hypothetical protein n=1 Tax=Legionella sp. CNM-4043-24 TaxID=3421646 RepID=UPI00403A985E